MLPVVLLAASLTGCASTGGLATKPVPGIESRMGEAADALDAVNRQSSVFYQEYNALTGEIKKFCALPGWTEFEAILHDYPNLKDPDGEIEITPEAESSLSTWAKRWKTSWEETLVDYHGLVDKCIILDAKRLAARERLLAVQAKYIGAVMLALSAGREAQAKEIYALVEVLDKTGAELNSFQTDDLGLYR